MSSSPGDGVDTNTVHKGLSTEWLTSCRRNFKCFFIVIFFTSLGFDANPAYNQQHKMKTKMFRI